MKLSSGFFRNYWVFLHSQRLFRVFRKNKVVRHIFLIHSAGGKYFLRMSMFPHKNIILIGMPGSGKSTVGVLLAKMTSRRFIDTDILIQNAERRTLQEIIDRDGYLCLREIEENILLSIKGERQVVATGGSAVYSLAAMNHLKETGIVVFLEVSLETLHKRVRDYDTRGLARRPDQTIEELFRERHSLYEQYADLRIVCDAIGHDDICKKIMKMIHDL
jgi:shikimate kinase